MDKLTVAIMDAARVVVVRSRELLAASSADGAAEAKEKLRAAVAAFDEAQRAWLRAIPEAERTRLLEQELARRAGARPN